MQAVFAAALLVPQASVPYGITDTLLSLYHRVVSAVVSKVELLLPTAPHVWSLLGFLLAISAPLPDPSWTGCLRRRLAPTPRSFQVLSRQQAMTSAGSSGGGAPRSSLRVAGRNWSCLIWL